MHIAFLFSRLFAHEHTRTTPLPSNGHRIAFCVRHAAAKGPLDCTSVDRRQRAFPGPQNDKSNQLCIPSTNPTHKPIAHPTTLRSGGVLHLVHRVIPPRLGLHVCLHLLLRHITLRILHARSSLRRSEQTQPECKIIAEDCSDTAQASRMTVQRSRSSEQRSPGLRIICLLSLPEQPQT